MLSILDPKSGKMIYVQTPNRKRLILNVREKAFSSTASHGNAVHQKDAQDEKLANSSGQCPSCIKGAFILYLDDLDKERI